MSNSQDPFMRLLSGFSEDAEAAGSSIEKQFQRQSRRRTKPKRSPQTSTKPKPSPQTSGEDAKNEKRAAGVMVALGNFAKSLADGLEKEGERRSKRGLSGAGFAAAFSSGIEGLTDYTDMLQGNAAPGEVLYDAAMSNIERRNQQVETDSNGQPRGVDALEITEKEEEGEFPDLLARPVETEEADIVPNTIRQAVQEGIERGAEITGPPRPVLLDNPGTSFNMMEALKRYSPQTFTKPVSLLSPGMTVSITEEEAMRRKEVSRSNPNTLPEAMQPTGVGDTAYRSVGQASGSGLVPMPGTPFTPGSYTAGGRAIPAQ